MGRREELGQLRAENREGRDAQQGCEMAGAGIVADESIGRRQQFQQAIKIGQRVVDLGHFPARLMESSREFGESLRRPTSHGLTGAGVDDDVPAGAERRICVGQRPAERRG